MSVLGLVFTVLLLLGNGLFVGAEFSVIAARPTQVEPKARINAATGLPSREIGISPTRPVVRFTR